MASAHSVVQQVRPTIYGPSPRYHGNLLTSFAIHMYKSDIKKRRLYGFSAGLGIRERHCRACPRARDAHAPTSDRMLSATFRTLSVDLEIDGKASFDVPRRRLG